MQRATIFILTILLWGWSQSAFAVTNSFTGVYIGTSSGPPCMDGHFGAIVKGDGTFNLLYHDVPDDGGALDLLENFVKEGVVIAPDGTFSTSAIIIDGTTTIIFNMSGTFDSSGVSGTFSNDQGCAGTFAGNKVTGSGPLAEAGGYYSGTHAGTLTLDGILDGTLSGTVHAIVAADGSGMLVKVTELRNLSNVLIDAWTEGGPITVDPFGSFSDTLDEVLFNGSFNLIDFTGSGGYSGTFFEGGGTVIESGTFTLTRQFGLTPNLFAGVYRGNATGCLTNELGVFLDEGGVAHILGVELDGTGDVWTLNVLADGSFDGILMQADGSPDSDPSTATGSFTATGFSGTITEFDGLCVAPISGTRSPDSGFFSDSGGYYTGPATVSGVTGVMTAIIAADGAGFADFDVAEEGVFFFEDGGSFTVDSSTLAISGTLLGGAPIAGTLDDILFTASGTFSVGGTWSLARDFALPAPHFPNDVVMNIPGTGVSVLLNDNTSSVLLHADTAAAIAVADVDGNGVDDVIVSFPATTGPDGNGGTYISRNEGPLVSLDPQTAEQIVAGDFDGSGQDDLFLDFGVGGLSSYMNDTAVALLTPESPLTMAVGDVDNNGADDAVFSFTAFGTVLFLNFSVVSILDPGAAETLELGDIDGNGEDDIIASFPAETGPGGIAGVYIARNQGPLTLLTGTRAAQVLSGDFDGSGQDDLVFDFGGATGLWLYLNDASVQFLTLLSPVAMAAGDMDSNGQDDLIISFTGIGTIAYKNLSVVETLDPVGVATDLATGNVDGN